MSENFYRVSITTNMQRRKVFKEIKNSEAIVRTLKILMHYQMINITLLTNKSLDYVASLLHSV